MTYSRKSYAGAFNTMLIGAFQKGTLIGAIEMALTDLKYGNTTNAVEVLTGALLNAKGDDYALAQLDHLLMYEQEEAA